MKTITNTKTNNIGTLVVSYNRVSDGVAMFQVVTLSGQKAFWLASHCEAA